MKRALSMMLVLALLCTLLSGLSLSVHAADASGELGSLSWRIKNNVLTISGTGEMQEVPMFQGWKVYNNDVTRLIIEPGVTTIAPDAFFQFHSLTEVSIPGTVQAIGTDAFASCPMLTKIVIPEGVVTVGSACFEYSTALKEVILPSTLQNIYSFAFSHCEALTEIQLPAAVTTLGANAFYGCTALRSARLNCGISKLESSTFYECTALQEVILPDTLKEIGDRVFFDCYALEQVRFPEGLEVIGTLAFSRTPKLMRVDLPASVREIGESAFSVCGSRRVTIRNPQCSIGPDGDPMGQALGPNPVVIAYYDSTAYDYAVAHGYAFEALDGCALGVHAFTKTEIITPPTCQAEGERRLTCEFCGESKTEPIPIADHNDVMKELLQAPTFFAEGRCVYTCTMCGRTTEGTLQKLNPGYTYQEVLYNRDDWSGAYVIGGYTFNYSYDGSYELSGLKLLTPRLDTVGPYAVTERANIYGVQTNTAEYAFIFEKLSDGSYTIRSYWTGQYLARNGAALIRIDNFDQSAKWNIYVDSDGYFVIASTSAPAYQLLYNEVDGYFHLLDTYTYEGTTYQAEDIFGIWLYEPDPCMNFLDVDPTAWYHEGIDFAVTSKLFNGVSSTRFGVDSTMTRAMFVTVLWRLEGEPAANGGKSFSDVPEGTWYTDAVAWAFSEGIVNGTSETTFSPDAGITREQMAVLMYRYANWLGLSVGKPASLSGFPDAAQVSDYAVEALGWATGSGIVTGTTAGNSVILKPQGGATRAQVATILMRFLLAYLFG